MVHLVHLMNEMEIWLHENQRHPDEMELKADAKLNGWPPCPRKSVSASVSACDIGISTGTFHIHTF